MPLSQFRSDGPATDKQAFRKSSGYGNPGLSLHHALPVHPPSCQQGLGHEGCRQDRPHFTGEPIAVPPALFLDIDGEGPRPDMGILDRVAGLHRDPHGVLASADPRHPFERMSRAAVGFVIAESQGVGEPRRLHLGCVNNGPHET